MMKRIGVRVAAPVALGLIAAATSMCARSSPSSPSSFASVEAGAATNALGDSTGSTPVAGTLKVCKTGNVSGTYTVVAAPVAGGTATVLSPATVAPTTCIVVALSSSLASAGANITLTETSAGLQSVSAQRVDNGVVSSQPFANGGTLFLNSFHGYTVTFVNNVAPPPAVALFVIGDVEPHAVNDVVNFWGAQWWKNNVMSGFVSNGEPSFKGYATESDNVCGGKWISRPGNSSDPPDTIPDIVRIIVTDTVVKNGADISGNIKALVDVRQDGGYGPSPGKDGNGPVIRVFCQ
jgi:hypothetical protein